jgi:dihydrodipicolinate synthase/N-acetylneuraminate lyase
VKAALAILNLSKAKVRLPLVEASNQLKKDLELALQKLES